jgi:DNA-binding IclR family transcriptional regulator
VNDALLDVTERVHPDTELLTVAAQRLHLRSRYRIGDRLVEVEGRHVVVLCRQRQVGTPHLATSEPQAVEGLRAGDLVHEVEVDVEKIRLTVCAPDDVLVPHLLGHCAAHVDLRCAFLRLGLASRDTRRQYQVMDNSSGVGVLDKAAVVLAALESGPATLAGLVQATGLARPTAHRLAVALEHHRLVARDMQGRFMLGPRLNELAAAAGEDRLLATAGPVLARLRDITGESAQLFRRQGDYRICVAAAERPSGLRDTIPVGSQLTMQAGSAAQVLLSWEDPERLHRGLQDAAFSAAALSGIRRRGWAQSVGEREPGVASVSAPVRSPSGKVIAAVSVSGPIERLTRQPGRMHAPAVMAAAERLSESLRRSAE